MWRKWKDCRANDSDFEKDVLQWVSLNRWLALYNILESYFQNRELIYEAEESLAGTPITGDQSVGLQRYVLHFASFCWRFGPRSPHHWSIKWNKRNHKCIQFTSKRLPINSGFIDGKLYLLFLQLRFGFLGLVGHSTVPVPSYLYRQDSNTILVHCYDLCRDDVRSESIAKIVLTTAHLISLVKKWLHNKKKCSCQPPEIGAGRVN